VFESFFKRIWKKRKPASVRTNAVIGRDGEEAAAKHLARLGMNIRERNWTCKAGEIDLICLHRDTWVFVEVKTSDKLGIAPPEARVNTDKQRRLRKLARYYLGNKSETASVRFDVVAVWWENDEIEIRHYENAF
jgi:putative endonuclease